MRCELVAESLSRLGRFPHVDDAEAVRAFASGVAE